MTTTQEAIDLRDKISLNIETSHSLSIVMQAAIDHESPPTNKHLSRSMFAIAALLGEAEKAELRLLRIKAEQNRGTKQ